MAATAEQKKIQEAAEEARARIESLSDITISLYDHGDRKMSLLDVLLGKADQTFLAEQASNQGTSLGRRAHPFDMFQVINFQNANEYHATCIETKAWSMVGLGYDDEPIQEKLDPNQPPLDLSDKLRKARRTNSKVDIALDPICDETWQSTLYSPAEDYVQVGVGHLEVLREGGPLGPIRGIYHIPAHQCHVFLENEKYDWHFEIVGEEGETNTRRFCRFGDKESFIKRAGSKQDGFEIPTTKPDEISEVIRFRQPSSRSRWYSYPKWLSAVAAIELSQCMKQDRYDYHLNRGVPEFLLWVLGAKLAKKDWDTIVNSLKNNIGMGKKFKSNAINLPNRDLTIQLDKLGFDRSVGEDFSTMGESLAQSVVTAHRVPPLLAGIQIPGKLGATNELPNALMAFQILVNEPSQRVFRQTLGQTLGNPALNGGELKLTVEDFTFRALTDLIDFQKMDTVSRMRETVPEAAAKGRDLKAGLKD